MAHLSQVLQVLQVLPKVGSGLVLRQSAEEPCETLVRRNAPLPQHLSILSYICSLVNCLGHVCRYFSNLLTGEGEGVSLHLRRGCSLRRM